MGAALWATFSQTHPVTLAFEQRFWQTVRKKSLAKKTFRAAAF
jgi:hypothetical protein